MGIWPHGCNTFYPGPGNVDTAFAIAMPDTSWVYRMVSLSLSLVPPLRDWEER